MKAIIFVAGYATRLYPITEKFPKALIKINNKTIMDYIVDQINTIEEIDEIFCTTNDKYYDLFNNWAKERNNFKPIKVLNDGTNCNENRLGAIGDIIFTIHKENIDDDILAIAGDNLFMFSLLDFYNFYKKVNAPSLALFKTDNKVILSNGAVTRLDENNKVIEMEEKPINPKYNLVGTAIYFYPKGTLKEFDIYKNEGNILEAPGYFPTYLHKKMDIYAYIVNGLWFDVGTLESLETVRQLFYSKK